ncbi:polysaccharide biosynthesis protein [Gellertiella hungarica]|nr:nucleoside-diphosphate sugar epimerase/dehydratase [Gellertiella hungarica]
MPATKTTRQSMYQAQIIAAVLAIPRFYKRLIALSFDAFLCVLTVWFAYCLRLDGWVAMTEDKFLPAGVSLFLAIPIFISFGFYRAIFRYAGVAAFMAILRAMVIYSIGYIAAFTIISVPGVPRTIGILQPLLLLVFISVSRLAARYWLGADYRRQIRQNTRPNVLIYGAGTAGRQIALALDGSTELKVIGFVDDDVKIQGSLLRGVPIWSPQQLGAVISSHDVKEVLLALPSSSRQRRAEILEEIRRFRVNVRTVPDLNDIAQGRVTVTDLKELDIEDLLGRNAILPRPDLMDKNIRGKIVMVTGAGGSIGSELCRQIVAHEPEALILVEQSEFALYAIHRELEKSTVKIIPMLASVRDEMRMRQIMAAMRPDTLYHAAAYKHVPLVEQNPAEGVRNNTLGTMVTALAARDHGVTDFVLISTDKAVRPTNIMGASKRLAEMVLQALAAETTAERATNFCMVRFGNVLGSSGSVVPLFRQQIREGGPVTLTHADVTRYFMTIPEASQLVIQAGAMSRGGDVFLLDMGEPVRIYDLARKMIELSGLQVRDADNPQGDIEIEITGMRPGEKLYEELLIGDNPLPTDHPRILKAHEDMMPWPQLKEWLEKLDTALEKQDLVTARDILSQLVSGYKPESELHDLLITEGHAVPGPAVRQVG